jgi:DNA excision repair protein ERCC-2
MYSISFGTNDIEKAKKSLKKVQDKSIKNNLNKIKKYLVSFNDLFDDNGILEVSEFEESFMKMLSKFHELYTSLSSKDSKLITKEYKNLFNNVNKFLKLYELSSSEDFFTHYFKKINDEEVEVNIYCATPTKYVNLLTSRFKNSIVFSATLNPFNYYNELLFAGDESTITVAFDSPFDIERLNLNISSNISIKYRDRLTTLNSVISEIVAFVSVKKGNYFVFVPSFDYLKLLKNELFLDGVDFIYQEKEMSEKSKKEFIKNFTEESENSKVGICVLGGSFSESINLVGETLIGVIVIGVGMPSISYENNVLKKYYDSIGLDGFYYAYVIPGMKNVIQGVGRLIRTKNDYGSVLLIDDRYKQSNYRKLFRKERKNAKNVKNDYEIIENLNIFYKKILNQ